MLLLSFLPLCGSFSSLSHCPSAAQYALPALTPAVLHSFFLYGVSYAPHVQAAFIERVRLLERASTHAARQQVLAEFRSEYPFLSEPTVSRWWKKATAPVLDSGSSSDPTPRRGRPFNEEFRRDVLSQLMVTGDDEKGVKALNVLFSRAVLQTAARRVQGWPKYEDDERVRALKLGPSWQTSFLAWANLHRRRVTTASSKEPAFEDIKKWIEETQQLIEEKEIQPTCLLSADETAYVPAAAPINQYVSNGERASAPPGTDDKSRCTAMLAAAADGELLPAFVILKCSVKNKTDLTSSTILSTLHRQSLLALHAWQLKSWEKTLTVKEGNKMVQRHYQRPYLYNVATGLLLSVQNKAWMDTAGCIMWLELCVHPWLKQQGRLPAMIVWDGCGPHATQAVAQAAADLDPPLFLRQLPPNVTSKMQVMDLVVNGPLKSRLRRVRAENNFVYFIDDFKPRLDAWIANPVVGSSAPEFLPPKLGHEQVVAALTTTLAEMQDDAKLRAAISRTFARVCLAKVDGLWPQFQGTAAVVDQTSKDSRMESDQPSAAAFVMDIAVTSRADIHLPRAIKKLAN